jgi:lipopolysaccharide export system protein LptC
LTTVLPLHSRGAPAPSRAVRSDRQRRFRSARRHSYLVRFLRIGLPILVVLGGLGGYAAVVLLDPLRALARLPIDIKGVVISGTKVAMQAPRITGYTKDQRQYSVIAKEAAQDVTKPGLIELSGISATIETDRGKFEVTARDGLYENAAERLTLQNNVRVVSASYEGLLSEAVYLVKAGDIISEKPVEVRMQQAIINANRLHVTNAGEVIRFEGGVTMVVNEVAAESQGR